MTRKLVVNQFPARLPDPGEDHLRDFATSRETFDDFGAVMAELDA